MGNAIVFLEGHYLEWSSIVDAPVSYWMTRSELEETVRREYGNEGLRALRGRLERVDAKGTSAFRDEDADDTIWLNRAGPKEAPLHREEIIEFFVRRKVDPTPKALAAFRQGLPRCGPTCVAILDEDDCADFCRKCWGTDYVRPVVSLPRPRRGSSRGSRSGPRRSR